MKRAIALLAALLAASPAGAAGRPMRVVSMNQCTDQLVLMLLPPGRIASVTWLSRNPEGSLMSAAAAHVDVNHGLAEEIVRQRPDLVISGSFSTPATRGLLKRLGYPMIEVDDANTIDQIRAITRQVARAVGETARGEALLMRMDHKLADLARDPVPRVRVAAWDGAGFDASKGSLYDVVLEAAGAVNVANEAPAAGHGMPDTEILLAVAPDLLVQGSPVFHRPGLRDNVSRHPLVRRYWGKDRTLSIRQAYYICGTPLVADGILALRQDLRRAVAAARTRLPFASARP